MAYTLDAGRICQSRHFGFRGRVRIERVVGEGGKAAVGCQQHALGATMRNQALSIVPARVYQMELLGSLVKRCAALWRVRLNAVLDQPTSWQTQLLNVRRH